MRATLRAMFLIAALALAAQAWAFEIKLEPTVKDRRAGSFELNGVKYRLQLIDGNHNGRFNDFLAPADPRAKPDTVMISCGKYGFGDEQELGRYFLVGDQLFAAGVDAQGDKITLEPADGVAATLPRGVAMAVLADEKTTATVTVYDAAEKVKLPAGGFRLISYALDKQDDQGDHWFARVYGNKNLPALKVASTSATLVFGEPFTPRIEIQTSVDEGWFSDTITAQMNLTVHDAAGARLGGIHHFGNKTKIPLRNGRPANPTWRAVTADGEKAGSGQFEYG